MSNWEVAEEEGQEACSERDARDARKVCEQLGIGFHRISFVREYWNDVFEPLLQGYQAGGTPNPDIMCNRFIKFDRFFAHARALGADRVATGHYARLAHGSVASDPSSASSTGNSAGQERSPVPTRLLMGVDAAKDQSYFLSKVRQEALQFCDFPIGHLHKSEVRARAAAAGLLTATKPDSMGICFIGKRNFADFLEGYLPQFPGRFVCADSGRDVGEHRGYAVYTPGQRARVSGLHTRWYVVEKDAATNVVKICEGSDHPALFARSLWTHPASASWISGAPPPELVPGRPFRCHARVRHPGELYPCTVEIETSPPLRAGAMRLSFDEPVRGLAEMQAIALYDGDICLGGATIWERGPTLWDEARALHRVGYNGGSEHGAMAFVSG